MDWAAKEGDEEAGRVENSEKESRSFLGKKRTEGGIGKKKRKN